MSRQRDTADVVAAELSVGESPAVDPRWDEYDHLGLIERYLGDGAAEGLESRRVQPLLDRALERWIGEGERGGWPEFAGGATGVVALNRVMVNGSITSLVVGGSGTNLLSFNDHPHFAGERRDLLTYR